MESVVGREGDEVEMWKKDLLSSPHTDVTASRLSQDSFTCRGSRHAESYPSPQKLEIEKTLLTAGPGKDKTKIKTKTNFLPLDPRMWYTALWW